MHNMDSTDIMDNDTNINDVVIEANLNDFQETINSSTPTSSLGNEMNGDISDDLDISDVANLKDSVFTENITNIESNEADNMDNDVYKIDDDDEVYEINDNVTSINNNDVTETNLNDSFEQMDQTTTTTTTTKPFAASSSPHSNNNNERIKNFRERILKFYESLKNKHALLFKACQCLEKYLAYLVTFPEKM
eukprot:Pgem_evm1s11016